MKGKDEIPKLHHVGIHPGEVASCQSLEKWLQRQGSRLLAKLQHYAHDCKWFLASMSNYQ